MVNMESNIQQMFDKLKEFFWESSLDMANFEVKWDKTAIISSDSVFKIFEDERQVLISASAMIKPRIQLVSIILHVLIHIYLKTCSKGAISMNVHDDNFREIMLIFNSKLNTKISVRKTIALSSCFNKLSFLRHSTRSRTHQRNLIFLISGTSAREFVKTTSLSMGQSTAFQFQASLKLSGKAMNSLVEVSSSKSSRCRAPILKPCMRRRLIFATSDTCSRSLVKPTAKARIT